MRMRSRIIATALVAIALATATPLMAQFDYNQIGIEIKAPEGPAGRV